MEIRCLAESRTAQVSELQERGLECILRARDHERVWWSLALFEGHCGLFESCCGLVVLFESRRSLVVAAQASELQRGVDVEWAGWCICCL